MKNTINQVVFAAILFTLFSFAKDGGKKRATIKVYGKCGMCENRIESTLKNTEGVLWADWEIETQELTVKYDPDTITLDEIKHKVAEVGHDTEDIRATEEAYESLHACCKYERPE